MYKVRSLDEMICTREVHIFMYYEVTLAKEKELENQFTLDKLPRKLSWSDKRKYLTSFKLAKSSMDKRG